MYNVVFKLVVEEGFYGVEFVCLFFVIIEDDSCLSIFYLNFLSILYS